MQTKIPQRPQLPMMPSAVFAPETPTPNHAQRSRARAARRQLRHDMAREPVNRMPTGLAWRSGVIAAV